MLMLQGICETRKLVRNDIFPPKDYQFATRYYDVTTLKERHCPARLVHKQDRGFNNVERRARRYAHIGIGTQLSGVFNI